MRFKILVVAAITIFSQACGQNIQPDSIKQDSTIKQGSSTTAITATTTSTTNNAEQDFISADCVPLIKLEEANNTKVIMDAEIVDMPNLPDSLFFAGEKTPLDNPAVKEWLTNEIIVTKYMHSRTAKSLLMAGHYFHIIEPILKEHGIPSDFKYLCVAESSLDPNAYSSASAAGLWQLMSGTAKDYKLEVNSTVDERYHIEKSTIVACQYLKKAYVKFGSWTMAAASYNVGMAGLSRRSKTQQVTNYYDLFLPNETMRYVYRILTYKVLFEDPMSLGFNLDVEDRYTPRKYKIVVVKGSNIDWVALAKKHNTTYKDLREINSWIREYKHTNSAGKSYSVKIPAAKQ